MGFFAALVVDELRYEGDRVINSPTVWEFDEQPFVSWASETPPRGNFFSLGRDTIFIKRPVPAKQVEYDRAEWTKPLKVRSRFKPKSLWEYTASFHRMPFPLAYHVLLPDLAVPDWFKVTPNHMKMKESSIVVTWVFQDGSDIEVKFSFRPPDAEMFQRFSARLSSDRRFLEPSISGFLGKIGREALEQARQLTAEVLARAIQR